MFVLFEHKIFTVLGGKKKKKRSNLLFLASKIRTRGTLWLIHFCGKRSNSTEVIAGYFKGHKWVNYTERAFWEIYCIAGLFHYCNYESLMSHTELTETTFLFLDA